MLEILDCESLDDFVGELIDSSREVYDEFLEEIKNEHNLKDTKYELEVLYFTTYLYIQKYVYRYITDSNNLKTQTDYIQADSWDDFKEKVKAKAKNLI